MTALAGLLSFARAIPWQAWAVAGLIVAVGLYGCQQRRVGRQHKQRGDGSKRGNGGER